MTLIVVVGTYYEDGGINEIFKVAQRNDRLDFFKYDSLMSLNSVD